MINWIKIKMLRTAAAWHDWRWHRIQKQIIRQYGLDCDELATRRKHHSIMSQHLNAIADGKELKEKKEVCCSCSPGTMPECVTCEKGNQ